jgi:bifunctional enzyme CysN/CysC
VTASTAPGAEHVVRVVVAGHVDHGKSTLIGRLLYDLDALHQTKIDDVLAASARRGVAPEWSYVLDSLQEERDQAVTIDTTRIWFTHAGRRYTIIDAPGHRQFLANMLSGAADADAAILVVDAAAGVGEQTLRHAYLLAFLGVRQVIVALNKIDVLDDPRARCAALERELRAALSRTPPAAIVPVSAQGGDNIARRSDATPWYDGPTIVEALAAIRPLWVMERPLRVTVQDVYRRGGTRIVAGCVTGGRLATNAALVLLPANVAVRAERLVRWPEGDVAGANAGETIGVVLDGDRFVNRGDTLAPAGAPPVVARRIGLEMFWLDERGPVTGERLRLKRGAQDVPVIVEGTPSIYDIEEAQERGGAGDAQYNLVRLGVRAAVPVVFDPRESDPQAARTVLLRGTRMVASGFTSGALSASSDDAAPVTLDERETRSGHRAAIVWLTGLSGAGKSTVAAAAERLLFDRGIAVMVLDGDLLRSTLNTDLGFSDADRAQSVRRAAAVAGILAETGTVALVSLISPFAADRAAARAAARHPFYEVYVNAPLAACEARDPKGLYRRARAGELHSFTGIDSPYEPPLAPDLELHTDTLSVTEAAERLAAFIEHHTRVGATG